MQVEITLLADATAGYSARDLGFLLHKHPAHLHERQTSAGKVWIFFPEATEQRTTAVLYLDIDPIGLVRGRRPDANGLLQQYVNDRPYVANSFLSVALGRCYGQTLAGKCNERQALADRPLSFEARITPVSAAGGADVIESLFRPLGYEVTAIPIGQAGARALYDLRLAGTVRLRDLLSHIYVLVPVLDNAKHFWIDRDEIDNLLAKGEGWLAGHPERELIARRALKHRRALVNMALARLTDDDEAEEEADLQVAPEEALEKPIRLHDQRLDAVMSVLRHHGAASVLDLGCGEGRLIRRLIKERGIDRILGIDASMRTLQKLSERMRLDQAGGALNARLSLQMGSLTYGDRRWRNFDAATLVEVIEHIDPRRLSSLELSLFADARPRLIVVTTPNHEYNIRFDGLAQGEMRHPDHRFEWSRAEFASWAEAVADRNGYATQFHALGPADETVGAPSQMAVFTQAGATP